MIITSLSVMAVRWFAAILAALVIAAVITLTNPFGIKTYTPEEAKAELEAYSQQSVQQRYLSLAKLYDDLAQWYEARAIAAAPTGYASIDDVMPKQDELYGQAEEYRRQANDYRAMAYTKQSPVNSSQSSQTIVY
jgi:acyl-CoA synthetase (AMP-forming)/AMP-acid ligase II